jgi:c-di-GMP-binding flagellar brake protein YcgR
MIPSSILYDDRRQHARKPLRSTAQVILPGDRIFDVRILDISAGGAGLVAAANPTAGTRFQLQFMLPTRGNAMTTIRTQVEVMHSIYSGAEHGFKVGVRFVQLDLADAAAVVLFVG